MIIYGFNFSKLYSWHELKDAPGLESKGVYLVSLGKKGDRRIVYVGETHSQSLGRRLRQFGRSAFGGKSGHSGGRTFRSKGYHKNRNLIGVAVMPVKEGLSKIESATYVQYVERAVVWKCVKKQGLLPACNSK